MKSYDHLSYDPIAWADELARKDVDIAEKVKEHKLKQQEERDEETRSDDKGVRSRALHLRREMRRAGGQPDLNEKRDRGVHPCIET